MIICKIGDEYKKIHETLSTNELAYKLEEIAYEFVKNLAVIPEKYYKKSLSRKWGKVPLGIFMVRSRNKISVYDKQIFTGYIYSTFHTKKLITFIAIKSRRTFSSLIKDAEKCNLCINYKIETWKDIHSSILKLNVDGNIINFLSQPN